MKKTTARKPTPHAKISQTFHALSARELARVIGGADGDVPPPGLPDARSHVPIG